MVSFSARNKEEYLEKGFTRVRLLDVAELRIVQRAVAIDDELRQRLDHGRRSDRQGGQVGMVVWNTMGDDTLGHVFLRSRVMAAARWCIASFAADLEPEDVSLYPFHTKIVSKPVKQGGAFEPHADFGFWCDPKYGILWPELVTIGVALDHSTLSTGCVEYVPRSHLLGSVIPHSAVGGQRAAEPEAVEAVLRSVGGWEALELEPGDGVFFHPLVLHRSRAPISRPDQGAQFRRIVYGVFNHEDNKPQGNAPRHPFLGVAVEHCDSIIRLRGAVPLSGSTPFLD